MGIGYSTSKLHAQPNRTHSQVWRLSSLSLYSPIAQHIIDFMPAAIWIMPSQST
jgi:hypothetical protein